MSRRRSKRRSATSSPAAPPDPPPVVFYIDECLSQIHLAAALRAAGATVVLPRDLGFAQDTPDDEWLPEVGRRGYFVLTKDRYIRTRHNELGALMRAGVGAFVVIVRKHPMTSTDQIEFFLRILPRLIEAAHTRPRPFVARVYRSGGGIDFDPPSRR